MRQVVFLQHKKRAGGLLLIGILLCGHVGAVEWDTTVSAQSAVVLEAQSGQILYELNAEEPRLIASTTKIMTALVVLEQCDLSKTVLITPEMTGAEGSSLYLRAGEELTVEQLLLGLLLRSGNDAAQALAIHAAGSEEAFVALMNEKAASLGLTNTHFSNASGLDAEDHYASAADLARIMAAAMKNEKFASLVGTKSTVIPATSQSATRYLTNHHKLLGQTDFIEGGKTGFTKAAGRTLVTSACQDGMRLICVTLCDPDDWKDHMALLQEGFARFERRSFGPEELTYAATVAGFGMALLAPDAPVSLLCEREVELRREVIGCPLYFPPVQLGQQLGQVTLSSCVDQATVALRSNCTVCQPTERRGFFARIWSVLLAWFHAVGI